MFRVNMFIFFEGLLSPLLRLICSLLMFLKNTKFLNYTVVQPCFLNDLKKNVKLFAQHCFIFC